MAELKSSFWLMMLELPLVAPHTGTTFQSYFVCHLTLVTCSLLDPDQVPVVKAVTRYVVSYKRRNI